MNVNYEVIEDLNPDGFRLSSCAYIVFAEKDPVKRKDKIDNYDKIKYLSPEQRKRAENIMGTNNQSLLEMKYYYKNYVLDIPKGNNVLKKFVMNDVLSNALPTNPGKKEKLDSDINTIAAECRITGDIMISLPHTGLNSSVLADVANYVIMYHMTDEGMYVGSLINKNMYRFHKYGKDSLPTLEGG